MTNAILDSSNKGAGITLSGGSLSSSTPTNVVAYSVLATSDGLKNSGKWYCEWTITGVGAVETQVGVAQSQSVTPDNTLIGKLATGYSYRSTTGNKGNNNSYSAYGATYTTGDVISVLLDCDAGTLQFWKNGADQGTAYSGLAGVSLMPGYTGEYGATATVNFGATAFVYETARAAAGYTNWNAIPPPPTPGNVAVTMQPLQGRGVRVAAGAANILPFVVVGGYNGIGDADFAPFIIAASGGHTGADCVLQPLTNTATGYQAGFADVSLEAATAAATGYDTAIAHAAVTLPAFRADATGTQGGVASGDARLELITAFGTGPVVGDAVLAQLTAGATGHDDSRGTAAVILAQAQASAAGSAANGGNAAVSLSLTVAATGYSVVTGNAAVSAAAMQAQATGLTGETGAAALRIALATAAATGHPVITASGAVVMPPAYADAIGHETVLAAFRTWVMNTRNLDLTEYTNYSFNSFTTFNGKVYGAGASGIMALTGADDAGTNIDARFMTGNLNDRASHEQSRITASPSTNLLKIPEVLLTVDTTGPLEVTIEKEDMSQYTYIAPYRGVDTMAQTRVTPGRGLRALDYRVQVANMNGGAFDIVELNVPLEQTKRRLGDR